jgi:hypothetical protein
VNAWTVTVEVGARLAHDGELWTVVAMETGCVVLAGPRGARKRVLTATLFADATTRVLGAHEAVPSPIGSVLDDLSDAERRQLSERLGHVREVLTGYRSGSADLAEPGEPRSGYDPSLLLADRYEAKATELGVTVRTLERWVAGVREAGPVGLVDRRSLRSADLFAGVDERWLAMCRTVLDEHTDGPQPLPQPHQSPHRRACRQVAGALRPRRRLEALLLRPGRQRLAHPCLGARGGHRRAVLG